mgnify:CR=1 FL=1
MPGGPNLEKLALCGDSTKYMLPKPLHGRSGCDFSFSGLKTAVRYKIDQLDKDIFNLIKKRTRIVKYMLNLKQFKNQIKQKFILLLK